MEVINKYRKELIILGVIIEIILVPLIVRNIISLKNKDSNDNSIPSINEIGKQEFGIMYRDSDTDSYKSYSGSILDAINNNYELNVGNSKCSDGANSTVTPSSVLSINGSTVTIKSNKTVYCTLYFDLRKAITPLELLESKPENLSSTLVGGMYRYQGTDSAVRNNYICFGTNDKAACTSDAVHYMYRIIGIDSSGRMKVISEYPLRESTTMEFTYNNQSNNANKDVQSLYCTNGICPKWNESLLFKRLNGTSNGSVKGSGFDSSKYNPDSTSPTPTTNANSDIFVDSDEYSYLRSGDGKNGGASASTWYNLILNYPWYYGAYNGVSNPANLTILTVYNVETGTAAATSFDSPTPPTIRQVSSKWVPITAKIGMTYLHDMLFANCDASTTVSNCLDDYSWLLPSSYFPRHGNLSAANCGSWWLIGVYGYHSINEHLYYGYCAAIKVIKAVSGLGVVRPVFYLTSGIKLYGNGTTTNPYVLE